MLKHNLIFYNNTVRKLCDVFIETIFYLIQKDFIKIQTLHTLLIISPTCIYNHIKIKVIKGYLRRMCGGLWIFL